MFFLLLLLQSLSKQTVTTYGNYNNVMLRIAAATRALSSIKPFMALVTRYYVTPKRGSRAGGKAILYNNIKGWGCACTAVCIVQGSIQQLIATIILVCCIKLHTAVLTSNQLESNSLTVTSGTWKH